MSDRHGSQLQQHEQPPENDVRLYWSIIFVPVTGCESVPSAYVGAERAANLKQGVRSDRHHHKWTCCVTHFDSVKEATIL